MKKFLKFLPVVFLAVIFAGCMKGDRNEVEKVNIYDYVKNAESLETPDMFDDGFRFEIQYGTSAVEEQGLGRSASEANSALGQERMARAEEWGYSLTHLDGVTDGMGREIVSTMMGDKAPTTRQEAVEKINEYLEKQYKSLSLSGVYYSMNGHYPWHHYAGEAGFDIIGSEIGEGINSYQWHIALNRGAARQYDTPWFIDFSMWHGPSILDYSDTPSYAESCKTGGHSLSLFERSMIMSYMSGANSLVAEGGGTMCFDDSGAVTEYGETCRKIYNFTNFLSDRGTPYTPFALVLDYYHGTYSGLNKKLAFDTFKYTDGDKMTDGIINMLWHGGISRDGTSEKGTLVNNGYGDIFDVLLQDADSTLLSSYPCLILSGGIEFSDDDVEKFTAYAENGGVLVLNSAYVGSFPEFRDKYSGEKKMSISYGNGEVIIYGGDYKTKQLDSIIKELTNRFVPFEFSKDIEYLVNVKDNSVLLTLINNNGVDKEFLKPAKVKSSKAVKIDIGYNGVQTINDVNVIYGDASAVLNGTTVSVTVPSGSTVILEYSLGE